MGNALNCTHVDLETTTTPAATLPPVRTSKTRVYKRVDRTMLKPIAIAHHYHERILRAVEREGVTATRLSGILNPVGLNDAIDWTLEMSDPFALLFTHLRNMGLTPEIAVEHFVRSPTGHRMIALSSAEDEDWISAFFSNPLNLKSLGDICDFLIQNNGRMLVIQPQHLRTTPDGSMTSLDTQYGSLLALAKDCNWDTSRAVPRTSS